MEKNKKIFDIRKYVRYNPNRTNVQNIYSEADMNRDILNSLQNRFILGISLTVITMVLVLATVIRTSAGNVTAEDDGTEYYK